MVGAGATTAPLRSMIGDDMVVGLSSSVVGRLP
jgi:hypothetical protein